MLEERGALYDVPNSVLRPPNLLACRKARFSLSKVAAELYLQELELNNPRA